MASKELRLELRFNPSEAHVPLHSGAILASPTLCTHFFLLHITYSYHLLIERFPSSEPYEKHCQGRHACTSDTYYLFVVTCTTCQFARWKWQCRTECPACTHCSHNKSLWARELQQQTLAVLYSNGLKSGEIQSLAFMTSQSWIQDAKIFWMRFHLGSCSSVDLPGLCILWGWQGIKTTNFSPVQLLV